MLPYRGQARRFAAAGLLALALPAAALVAACGSAPEAGPGPVGTPRTAVRDRAVDTPPAVRDTGTGTSAAASCAAVRSGPLLARSRVVFTGIFLPGPAGRPGGHGVLLSPARMRVTKYLKGHGPRIVTVETAVTRQGDTFAENSEGITPVAGQRWEIYASSWHLPFPTSVCGGDRPLGGRQGAP